MIKLIKPYDGSGDICKWIDKFKSLMKLQKVEGDTSDYIPYFLEGDAYELFAQLSEETTSSGELLEKALKRSFGIDSFDAFEILRSKRWDGSESVDVYLASIQRLASLCEIQSKEFVIHSFITGLPEETAKQLRMQIRTLECSLPDIVEKTRILLKDRKGGCTTLTMLSSQRHTQPNTYYRKELKCFKCLGSGHTVKYCRSSEEKRKCYKCNQEGHIAPNCRASGNEKGEYRAPVSLQSQ